MRVEQLEHVTAGEIMSRVNGCSMKSLSSHKTRDVPRDHPSLLYIDSVKIKITRHLMFSSDNIMFICFNLMKGTGKLGTLLLFDHNE